MKKIFILLLVSLQTVAQLSIDFPVERSVFQRDLANQGKIYISASISQQVDSVKARLVEYADNGELELPWVSIANQSFQGYILDSITAAGGWYRLELEAYRGGELLFNSQINKVGVGEVFIISGQSNAQGVPNYGGTGSQDDRVNCANFQNDNDSYEPRFPMQFSHLEDNSNIGPNGLSPWIWGEVGDSLVAKLGVPILFFNSAETGTLSYNWWQASRNEFTFSAIFRDFFKRGFPYHNLKISLKQYASLFGVRAILWHQGETDTSPGIPREDEIFGYYKELIENARNDFGKNVAWMFSKVSYSGGFLSQDVIRAQTRIINEPGFNIFEGPFTDNLQIPRPDGVHFQNTSQERGLGLLAAAWLEKLDDNFFANCRPILEKPIAPLEISCENNTASRIGIPSDYSMYRWHDGQQVTSRVEAGGTVRAILRDENECFKLSTAVNSSAILFNSPSAAWAEKDVLCPQETLTLRADTRFRNVIWADSSLNASLQINQSGEYSYTAENGAGCRLTAESKQITDQQVPDFANPPRFMINGFVLDADTSITLCEGSDVMLDAIGEWDSIRWSDGNMEFQRQVSESKNLNYFGYYGAGCSSELSSSSELTFLELPESPTIIERGFTEVELLDQKENSSIAWTINGILSGSGENPIKLDGPGSYSISAVESIEISEVLTCTSGESNELMVNVPNTLINVYPNPVYRSNAFVENIETTSDAEIFLYDIKGRLLFKSGLIQNWNERIELPVSELPVGFYFVKVKTGAYEIVKKLMNRN
ncbi:sialate O-acetylesterase [Jiulongibacter sp. NS-SX5]|uniref:sialate O-acetylesterase n=1 Tax=Jiulongibacter sp. NS-SX5 TaxID=3463854 RepID=UPI00405931AA